MTEQEARDDEREAPRVSEEEFRAAYETLGRHTPIAPSLVRDMLAAAASVRKHPEPEITDAEVARLQGVIAEVRKAWWTATEYNDAGNVIYTDDIEAAMDSIWAAIADETLGVPVGEGEQGE